MMSLQPLLQSKATGPPSAHCMQQRSVSEKTTLRPPRKKTAQPRNNELDSYSNASRIPPGPHKMRRSSRVLPIRAPRRRMKQNFSCPSSRVRTGREQIEKKLRGSNALIKNTRFFTIFLESRAAEKGHEGHRSPSRGSNF